MFTRPYAHLFTDTDPIKRLNGALQCDNGYTVVCSIHQPRSNIYDMFDYLLLLDGGRNVYFGPQAGVVPYFSNELHRPCGHFHNPADIFLDLLEEDKDLV